MTKKPKGKYTEIFLEGIRLGAARVAYEHKRDGRPLAVSRNGKATLIPPEEIEVPEWYLKEREAGRG